MEEIMEVTSKFINNVGFPIAVSIALFYQLMKTNEIVLKFTTAIDKNTNAIQMLADEIHENTKKEG